MSQGPTPSSPPPPSAAAAPEARPFASKGRVLTAFVNNCVETVTKAALALDTAGHHRPHARNLIKALWEKRRILVTCHAHPDPDALASCCGVIELLRTQLPDAAVDLSIKGQAPGGLNEIFLLESKAKSVPWESLQAESYDAIVLLDTHPGAGNNPLPASATLTAVIDHHQRRGRRPAIPFVDIRPSIGATCSLVFSYFMELDVPISPGLAALLLFGIETDLAGAAAQPDGLDNMALSSLTLLADARKLYRMRNADLPSPYMKAYHAGLVNAQRCGTALVSHIEQIDSPEQPAVIADFLLRWDEVHWSLVTASNGKSLMLSLRTDGSKLSAAAVMKRLVRQLGEGGGHRNKAGGNIPLPDDKAETLARLRNRLRLRLLRAVGLAGEKPVRLIARS